MAFSIPLMRIVTPLEAVLNKDQNVRKPEKKTPGPTAEVRSSGRTADSDREVTVRILAELPCGRLAAEDFACFTPRPE